ncbi:TPA: phage tail protein [Escherichia coli]|nr:phage tail protein [Escherichia coli]
MNRSDSPKKQPKPFGVNGQRGVILPTTPAGDNSASYELGFPPITMILKSAGGLPPKGQDMNQILYELSALGRWSSTGALNTFDSEFASEISGYPAGAMLISDDGERIFINTTEGNLSDPNNNGAGWKDAFSYLGLGEAAKRNVGTGANQIPDMSSYASGSGWRKMPDGSIEQWGRISFPDEHGPVSANVSFPIPFTQTPGIVIVCDGGFGGGNMWGATNWSTTGFIAHCNYGLEGGAFFAKGW